MHQAQLTYLQNKLQQIQSNIQQMVEQRQVEALQKIMLIMLALEL
jgi:hypothetical protein